MARRLFLLWVAIISLALLVQAAPVLAETYELPSNNWSWYETYGGTQGSFLRPGNVGSTFFGSNTWVVAEGEFEGQTGYWEIGDHSDGVKELTNLEAATESGEHPIITFVTNYDSIVSPGQVKFAADIPGGPSITAEEMLITITGTYINNDSKWHFYNQEGNIEGIGKNSDGTVFTISGILKEYDHDTNHWGYMDEFVLTYPASTVPIPGTVWLLSTGFLGIWCLGRRRKE